MQYTILGFSQTKLIEYNLNIIDVHILRWFVDFYQTGKMYKILEEGRTFCWVKYDAILNDIPLLGITNTRVIARRFDAMCECGLMMKVVKKTAKGTYSCFSLEPDTYNALLSSNDYTSSTEKKPVNAPTVPESTVEGEFSSENRATVLKSTVGAKDGDKIDASALESTLDQSVPEESSPTVPKSTVGGEFRSENRATVLKSTVATVPESTVLLKNPSTIPNPLTKIPASAVRTTLLALDPTLILDTEFYPAAADFLDRFGLDEEYLRWFYQHLKSSDRITNLAGYFFKVFFRAVYVERYKASRASRQEKIDAVETVLEEYQCPVCKQREKVLPGARTCACCDAPLHPSGDDIKRFTLLYNMDESTKEKYIFSRSKILRSGGNVSENLKALDCQFGFVS